MRLPLLSYKHDAGHPGPAPATRQKTLFSFFSRKSPGERVPCPACGTTNPAGVNYCKECGASYRSAGSPGAASPSRQLEERKQWLERGNDHFRAGRFPDAIRCYDSALSIDPSYAKAWNNKAMACEKLGLVQSTLECRQKFNELHATDR